LCANGFFLKQKKKESDHVNSRFGFADPISVAADIVVDWDTAVQRAARQLGVCGGLANSSWFALRDVSDGLA
jgi:hypothetical protein